MGFTYRRSLRAGPFRINLSRSGIGVSAGVPGFRITQSSTGRRYTTFNIPGSGMSYRKPIGRSRQGCLGLLVAGFGLAAAAGLWIAALA